jgi:hypothetical protein
MKTIFLTTLLFFTSNHVFAQDTNIENNTDVSQSVKSIPQIIYVKGPKGFTGPMGYSGNVGVKGFMGMTGLKGPKGLVGPRGANGAIGPQGDQGLQGSRGPDVYYFDNNCPRNQICQINKVNPKGSNQ